MKKRRKARELALQGLYAWQVSGNSEEAVLDDVMAWAGDDQEIREFAADLVRKTIQHVEILDRDVAEVLENWEFQRIALIDRIILRMALCELLHFEVIPPKVTINEAIDLAKTYSTAQSGRFVNGILDSIYQRLKAEEKIYKSGRGLMDFKQTPVSGQLESGLEIKIERDPDEERLRKIGVFGWPVWTKEVSRFPWTYNEEETCFFLEGHVIVTPESGDPVEMGEGDLVTFPKGLLCTWDVQKPVKKHYRFQS